MGAHKWGGGGAYKQNFTVYFLLVVFEVLLCFFLFLQFCFTEELNSSVEKRPK